MIVSIRKFLLINLLIAIIITTFLTALGNYYLDQKDIERHLDTLLRQAAFSFEALLGEDFNDRNLAQLQRSINAIPGKIIMRDEGGTYDPSLAQKYQFQVWGKDGQLLLHSSDAPNIHLSEGKQGFSNKIIDHQHWRSYVKQNSELGLRIEVAEEYDMRNRLAAAITHDDIYIILLTYPIAAFLIWFIIGRGLQSIDRVAKEVSQRLPNYLEPVDSSSVPEEIRSLVMELNKLFLRLSQAFDREKRFAGDAAHELRTPLAALKTQAQVALQTKDPVERKNLLDNVILGVDRCAHVVQQLLTMSRLVPEANFLTDAVNVELPKLASEVIAQLVPIALDKHIEIELIAKDEKAVIWGNITALSILIRNLVDNAIRYTPQGGLVQVIIESDEDKSYLRVIDNGPGIPAELRARVFERFFRVLGNKSPGSGLGLAIVQQIAHLHNAQVTLGPPQSGRGLEVSVGFPKSEILE